MVEVPPQPGGQIFVKRVVHEMVLEVFQNIFTG